MAFNIFLHATDYGKRYVYCIVGGLAGEGFMFWTSKRYREEEEYEAGVGVLYRKYRKWSGINYHPDTCIKTFNFYEWFRPWLFIYMVMGLFFLVIYLLRRTSMFGDPRWRKVSG